MQNIEKLREIIKKLRAPDGCPWDRKQTHASVRGHLVEECAELLDAIDRNDIENMREELGDVLMHLLLHSEIASENNDFNFDDVTAELAEKLVRRHPHVFGDKFAKDADAVLEIWNDVKKSEKRTVYKNIFEKVPKNISALRFAKDVEKAFPDLTVEESLTAEQMLGKKIYDIVKECNASKVEPEGALRDYINLLREKADA